MITSPPTAQARPRPPAFSPITSSPSASSGAKRALLVCGIVSSLIYVASNVLGAIRWEGYSSLSQTVSELYAIGAPSRSLVLPIGIAYDVLLFAFGIGIWKRAERKSLLHVTALLLMTIAALGTFWPPMHMRGAVGSLTDTLHLVFAGIVVLCTVLAVVFAASAFGPRFRIYSFATIFVLLLFGSLTALDGPRLEADLPTPWMGLWERINIGAYLAWIVALAIRLLRDVRPSRA